MSGSRFSGIRFQLSGILLINSGSWKREHETSERGNVLVTSLLILLVMNLLGIGLANLSMKEWTMATYKTVDAQVFHTADAGCIQQAITFFGAKNSTPSADDIANLSASALGTAHDNLTEYQLADASISHKLTGYSYGCNVTYIISKQDTSGTTSGSEIGNSAGSYSTSGNQVIKDYYRIISTGSGPKNSSKTVNTIISVEY